MKTAAMGAIINNNIYKENLFTVGREQ